MTPDPHAPPTLGARISIAGKSLSAFPFEMAAPPGKISAYDDRPLEILGQSERPFTNLPLCRR